MLAFPRRVGRKHARSRKRRYSAAGVVQTLSMLIFSRVLVVGVLHLTGDVASKGIFSRAHAAERYISRVKIFVSYSTRDDAAVRSLVKDLESGRQQVWMDEELGGGETWWASILERIRTCAVFVFALSDNSLNSKPCRAELEYAKALGVPILPVQIGEVVSYRTDPIFSMQLVDYRESSNNSGIALISALHERAAQHSGLPDPLPDPPPIPFEYLQRLGATVRDEADLKSSVQLAILFELREALDDESDESVRRDIREILRALRSRKDVTYTIGRDIDSILEADPAGTADPTEVKRQAPAKSQRAQQRNLRDEGAPKHGPAASERQLLPILVRLEGRSLMGTARRA